MTDQKTKNWKLPFFSIWTGQSLSLVGSSIAQFALIWWLTMQTGSATVLAMASMAGLIPGIVLGPIAGAYVDRWDRRLVMIAADGLVALASLLLAYLFLLGQMEIWHVYLAMMLRSVGGSFHWPAMQASTSLMVPKEHIGRVAGLNQTMNGVLNIVGPPLGALLMSVLPLEGVMMVDVGTAAFAIAPLLFVMVPQPVREDLDKDASSPTIWADMREGLHYLRTWPGMMALIGSVLLVKLALTPAFSLLPLLVSEHFGGDAAQLSLLEAVAGVGIVVGGLVLSVWGGFERKMHTSTMGIIILGIGMILLGLVPSTLFVMALAAIMLVGLMLPMIDGPFLAIFQIAVAPEKQGRVFTLVGSLLGLTSPLGLAIAGPVSDWLGLQVWYWVAGVLSTGVGIMFLFNRAILQIEDKGEAQKTETESPTPMLGDVVVVAD